MEIFFFLYKYVREAIHGEDSSFPTDDGTIIVTTHNN